MAVIPENPSNAAPAAEHPMVKLYGPDAKLGGIHANPGGVSAQIESALADSNAGVNTESVPPNGHITPYAVQQVTKSFNQQEPNAGCAVIVAITKAPDGTINTGMVMVRRNQATRHFEPVAADGQDAAVDHVDTKNMSIPIPEPIGDKSIVLAMPPIPCP